MPSRDWLAAYLRNVAKFVLVVALTMLVLLPVYALGGGYGLPLWFASVGPLLLLMLPGALVTAAVMLIGPRRRAARALVGAASSTLAMTIVLLLLETDPSQDDLLVRWLLSVVPFATVPGLVFGIFGERVADSSPRA